MDPAWGIIGTITGAIIGALITYFALTWAAKRQEFNKAAAEFRLAFLDELAYLRHNVKPNTASSVTDIGEFLRAGHIKHMKALVQFEPYLSGKEKDKIHEAWEEYCYHEKAKTPFFEQYSWIALGKGKDKEKELKALALQRIERILEHAKTK